MHEDGRSRGNICSKVSGGSGGQSGFTLAELLVVLAILILGAVALGPQAVRAGQARTDELLASRVAEARAAIEMYAALHSSYPRLLDDGWTPLVGAGYLGRPLENPLLPIAAHRTRIVNGYAGVPDAGWHWAPEAGVFGATFFDEGTGLIDPGRP